MVPDLLSQPTTGRLYPFLCQEWAEYLTQNQRHNLSIQVGVHGQFSLLVMTSSTAGALDKLNKLCKTNIRKDDALRIPSNAEITRLGGMRLAVFACQNAALLQPGRASPFPLFEVPGQEYVAGSGHVFNPPVSTDVPPSRGNLSACEAGGSSHRRLFREITGLEPRTQFTVIHIKVLVAMIKLKHFGIDILSLLETPVPVVSVIEGNTRGPPNLQCNTGDGMSSSRGYSSAVCK